MNTTKILESEISEIKVASLPSRPTAPTSFGGRGYTAKEMKEAFDKLPLFIIERFNMLLDDIGSTDEGSLLASIPTGLMTGHTLRNFFIDLTNGDGASFIALEDTTLAGFKASYEVDKERNEARFLEIFAHITDTLLDGGSPSMRHAETGDMINE